MDEKNTGYEYACSLLTPRLRHTLSPLEYKLKHSVREIILRKQRPVCIALAERMYYISDSGCLTDDPDAVDLMKLDHQEMDEIFVRMCENSVYAHQDEINSGYISLGRGCRAGICGRAVMSEGSVSNIRDISTINIRIPREVIGCSDKLLSLADPMRGILICGAPSSGKTTLIRDIARALSKEYKISLLDERNELSATYRGEAFYDIGNCDVFVGYPKCDSIIRAVRTMSPRIIICDELGGRDDAHSLIYASNCGVAFIATIHISNREELLRRKICSELLETYAFERIVFLESGKNVGMIRDICSLEEIYA